MKKSKLKTLVTGRVGREKRTLQLIFDTLNKGQTKKLLANEEILAEVERLGIEVKE